MRFSLPVFIFLAGLAALESGCRTAAPRASDVSTIEGASHASVHVLFDNTRPLPLSGTFGWGMSMVQVDSGMSADLSVINLRLHRSLLATLPEKGFTYTDKNPDYPSRSSPSGSNNCRSATGHPEKYAWQRRTEYQLAPAGRELRPIVMGLGKWGMKWDRGHPQRAQGLNALTG